jgi:hypothetical protein
VWPVGILRRRAGFCLLMWPSLDGGGGEDEDEDEDEDEKNKRSSRKLEWHDLTMG